MDSILQQNDLVGQELPRRSGKSMLVPSSANEINWQQDERGSVVTAEYGPAICALLDFPLSDVGWYRVTVYLPSAGSNR
jgi:hypothetical protein